MRRSISSLTCASRLVADNLAENNGEESWILPVPDTLVIASDRRIEYGFAEPDFTLRADPDKVLAVLDKL
jgi:peroxiredoxin